MFSKTFPVYGKMWYFDIDVVVRGNPFIKDVQWDKLNLLYSHFKSDDLIRLTNYDVKINSSVMAWHLWQSRCTLRSTVPARRLPAHNGPSLLCKSLARLPVSRTPTLRYVKLRKTHPWKLFLGLVQNESKAHRLISICTKPRKSFSRQIFYP